ncbi:MAG: type II toxin-antitoxin system VapB family antitoxin [Tunicatimonas sp.]
MRIKTNINIDDAQLEKAMKTSKAKTKKEAVERGLQELIKQAAREDMRALRGKVEWEGELDEMRSH